MSNNNLTVKKQKELELWQSYSDTGSTEPLGELLTSYDPLLQQQVNRYSASPLPRPALETEARRLTVRAFQTYDPDKSQLNTHVTNHLKHLQRFTLNYQNVGKIPENRGIKISRYQNMRTNLEDELGREPTVVEISDAMQIAPAEVERMQLELRQDLNIIQARDDAFFDHSFGRDMSPLQTAIEFVYYDASSEDKKIMEYTFGLGGTMKKDVKGIALALGKNESYVRRRRREIAQEIKNAEMVG